LNVLDLFSGIGGFSLGLERAGMQTVAFCECDRYARAVLRKHWPSVPCYDDVRTLTATRLAADGIDVDLICGGFPCQDISLAGSGDGLDGERSKLWHQFARIVGEVRPRFVVVENSSALLGRGLLRILGDLAAFGFDAEWHCLQAADIGAPHIRDRTWIVAHSDSNGRRGIEQERRSHRRDADASGNGTQGDARWSSLSDSDRQSVRHDEQRQARRRDDVSNRRHAEPRDDGFAQSVADADNWRREVERLTQHAGEQSTSGREPDGRGARRHGYGTHMADAGGTRLPSSEPTPLLRAGWWHEGRAIAERGWWRIEPDVGRVAHGVPKRVDRLRCLGNSVVPEIVEAIGIEIMRIAA
jgi:DNA (cytosine-5)-methyltransferase 1